MKRRAFIALGAATLFGFKRKAAAKPFVLPPVTEGCLGNLGPSGSVGPSCWVMCDGTEIPRQKHYHKLYAALMKPAPFHEILEQNL